MIKDKKPKDFKNSKKDAKDFDFSDDFIKDQFNIGSAEFTGNIYLEEKNKDMDRHLILLNADKEGYHGTNEFIEDFYGKSVFRKLGSSPLRKNSQPGFILGNFCILPREFTQIVQMQNFIRKIGTRFLRK